MYICIYMAAAAFPAPRTCSENREWVNPEIWIYMYMIHIGGGETHKVVLRQRLGGSGGEQRVGAREKINYVYTYIHDLPNSHNSTCIYYTSMRSRAQSCTSPGPLQPPRRVNPKVIYTHTRVHRRLTYTEHTRTHTYIHMTIYNMNRQCAHSCTSPGPRRKRRRAAGGCTRRKNEISIHTWIHRRFIYKGDGSTHTQGTDPRVALGASGKLPWIYLGARKLPWRYLGAWKESRRHVHMNTYIHVYLYCR